MDLTTGLAATSNAITIIKALKDADNALDSAVVRTQLVEALNELVNSKASQLELAERIKELEHEVSRLKDASKTRQDLTEHEGYQYATKDGSPIGWPACPTCLSKESRITFLVQDGHYHEAKCPHCTTRYDPVTSFLEAGYTREDDYEARKQRDREKQNEQIREFGRKINGPNSWMGN